MKSLLFIFMFISTLFANDSFLKPSQAFQLKASMQKNQLALHFTLAKDIYLYKERFSVDIDNKDVTLSNINYPQTFKHGKDEVFEGDFTIYVEISNSSSTQNVNFDISYQGCSLKGLCYEPITKSFSFKIPKTKPQQINETDTIVQTFQKGNIGLILLTFFGFGLLLSLTPCIFPMIPILSSIIVAQGSQMSAKRGFILSLVYVLSMSMAYTLAGLLAGLFGSNIQSALQNPWVLSSFSALFVILALSMFGFFEISLPASLQSKISKKSDEASSKGGFLGVAIMGFLSALIVGPCVAPPLAGALVYIGQTGDALLGAMALFVLSLGMGVPLLIIGTGAGKFMPKAGGWMSNISKVFGVIMLFIAIYMLSRILDNTIVMFLYALLFIFSSVYLNSFEPLEKRGSWNALFKGIGIVSFLLGLSLFIGAISGAKTLLDPLSEFKSSPQLQMKNKLNTQKQQTDFIKVESLAQFNKVLKKYPNKKIMLDFYASWCTSCQELEHNTFSNPKVQSALKEYILIQADITKNSQENKALTQSFNLFGPPAILFFNQDHKEIKSKRIIGYKSADEFLQHITSF